jgi:hypothetical protein
MLPIIFGASRVSLIVAILLWFTFLLVRLPKDDNAIGIVTVAFVTITTPDHQSRSTSWNYHRSIGRMSSPVVRLRLARNIPDETTVTTTASEEKEIVEGSIAIDSTETSTAVPVDDDDDDDTTISSSTTVRSTVSASTESSTVAPPKIISPSTLSSPSSVFHVDCDEDDTSEECVFGSEEILGECLPERLVTLPIHTTSKHVNQLLRNTEQILRNMHINSTDIEMSQILAAKEAGRTHECIYANNYVDLGKIDTYVAIRVMFKNAVSFSFCTSVDRMCCIGESLTFPFSCFVYPCIATITALGLILIIRW